MIDHEIDRITAAIHRLRPDWPIRQLDTLIRSHLRDRPRRDVAVALTWIACDTTSTSPYRVLETGPWWLAVAVDGQTTGRREVVGPNEWCDHGNKPLRRCNCGQCVSTAEWNRRLAHDGPKPSLRELIQEDT